MPTPIIFKPQPIEQPDPPTTETLAVLRVARRARVTIAHAAVVAQLAGIGPQEARS